MGVALPDAFMVVEAWLASEKPKVKARRPPTSPEAAHGTKFQVSGWKRNAGKRLLINLRVQGEWAVVGVEVAPSAMYYPDIEIFGMEKARTNFGELVGGLRMRLAAVQRGPGQPLG
jgi:hypothetical protein